MTELLPEQQPPERKEDSHSEDADKMHLKISSWPPLGRSSIVSRHDDSVKFTVLLETASTSLSKQSEPQVCVWHNHNGDSDWGELSLKPIPEDEDVKLFHRSEGQNIVRKWFSGELSGLPKHGQSVSFTVKFLVDEGHEWKWIKDTTGIEDGQLHYQTKDFTKHSSHDLKHWFNDISSDISVQSERPETDNTHLYSLTAPIKPAKGEDSGYSHHQLGVPNHTSRWFGLVRLWSPWLAPRQGKGKLDVDKDAILLSFLRSDGLHVVVLGISGIDDLVTTFFNDERGNVIIKGRNDRTDTGTSRVLVAVADTFETANAAVWYHARKVVASLSTSDFDKETETMVKDVKPEWLEEWYDGLTYCTWNGLGQKLSEKKILDALDALDAEGIKITNLIIDDNWQSLAEGETQFVRGWSGFDANKEGFPNGLKATTTEIRKKHPNVNHIAVWHAILGYWGGIDPNGWIANNYKTIEVEKEPGVAGGTFTVVAAEDANRMYNDFYQFLSSVGVDAVKTDAQFFLDLLLHAPDRRNMIKTYASAWTIAHLRHMSSRAISCMSQTPQLLFNSQLPLNKPRLLVRNSDDFFPEVEASHPWHIFCNAGNSLLTQHLNVLPDWDMFQTSHTWAGFHAAARCVSGGPIYFTDKPGEHDLKLLKAMTAQTPRGKTVILRPHVVGKTVDAYQGYKDLSVLKIGTYVGFAQTGTAILGVFNVSGQNLNEFVGLKEFPGTEKGKYVVGSFREGGVSKVLNVEDNSPFVGVELEAGGKGWDILSAYPLKRFEKFGKTKDVDLDVAMMGLVDKMTGAAAVTGYDVYVEGADEGTSGGGRLRVWVQIKALGVLGVWISELEAKSVEEDFMVLIYGKTIGEGCVRKRGKVLEVDVEKAWKESGEEAGWSNEVSLEIFMR